jgi:hypothetical protein
MQVSSSLSSSDADDGCQLKVQASKCWILYWGPSQVYSCQRKFSLLRRGEYSYDIELNTSANMFYLLKHFLLLNLVSLKTSCNNLNSL